jgi:hypothetical protein
MVAPAIRRRVLPPVPHTLVPRQGRARAACCGAARDRQGDRASSRRRPASSVRAASGVEPARPVEGRGGVRPAAAGRASRASLCRCWAAQLADSRPGRVRLAAPRQVGRRLREGQLGQRVPVPAPWEPRADAWNVVATPILAGLHHEYRAAASRRRTNEAGTGRSVARFDRRFRRFALVATLHLASEVSRIPNHRHASATTAGEQLRTPAFVGKGATTVSSRPARWPPRQWPCAMARRLRNRFQPTPRARWSDARRRPQCGCRGGRVWYHQRSVLHEPQVGVLREVQFNAPGEARGDLEVGDEVGWLSGCACVVRCGCLIELCLRSEVHYVQSEVPWSFAPRFPGFFSRCGDGGQYRLW